MTTPANKRTPFGATFYVANTMEIFERLAWYGFFTLSSLYMTSPTAQGGLGFTDQERGFLQGMIPFLLYLFPVITGALADRYGYRKMFILSFIIMTPCYYLLGQVTDFWSFCLVFLGVAVGAACFKPVVVGTVGRVTDNSNRGLGFGVFYTMVNIGGFLGPLIAGYVRVIGWDMVFVMSSLWIAINFIPAIFLYKEPTQASEEKKSLKDVLKEAQQVLGNGRLALFIVPIIIGLMIAAKGAFSFTLLGAFILVWSAINYSWSLINKNSSSSAWHSQPIRFGNVPFVIYLLILTGFWTMYLQLFITTPLYIRDFVNTSDLVNFIAQFGQGAVDFLAGVNIEQLTQAITTQVEQYGGQPVVPLQELHFNLVNYKVMVPNNEISQGIQNVYLGIITSADLAAQWAQQYRQVNPEYIINLDFGVIVLFQIFISQLCSKSKPVPIILFGTIVIAIGFLIGGIAHGAILGGAFIVTSVIVFAFGEMIASPKSQEYVASIAPKENTAMYMGYYFVSMALGNLFAGLLSGWAYGYLAKELEQPMLMWLFFSAIGFITAIALYIFHKAIVPKWKSEHAAA